MTEKIKPTRNLLLCRAVKTPDPTTKGGIIIPDAVRGRADRAEVLAAGPGVYTSSGVLVAPCASPGDVIVFNPYQVIWVEGVDMAIATKSAGVGQLFMILDDAALAVVEPD